MRPIAICALLLAAVLAGCSSSGGKQPAAAAGVVEAEPGLFIRSDLSAIRGVVASDAGLAVPGARVLLVGSPEFADTRDDGAFRFLNVTPGPYTLRVEKPGFLVLEEDVTLTAGNVTVRDVVLLPDASIGAGYRPHVHDYWGDAATRLLMDEPITSGSAQRGIAYANLGSTSTYEFPFFLPDETPDGQPALVYPGTATLTVTFTWTQEDFPIDALVLRYRAPDGSDWATLPEQRSGVPWVIPVTGPMADNGHQMFTLWEFVLNAGNDARNAPNWSPTAFLGEVHVKMEVAKGTVPLEPEHPDFWANGPALVIRNLTEEYRLGYSVADTSRETSVSGLIRPTAGIVPPGTTRMRVEFTWTNARSVPSPEEWVLTWRSAEQHPRDTPFADFHRATPTETGAGRKVYEFAVDPAQTDAYYQKVSLWRFLPSKAGDEDRTQPIYHDDFALDYIFYLGITVFNDDA